MKKHIFSVAVLTLAVMLTTFSSCRKPQAEDNTPAKEGLYLGIVGFNSDLYTMPLGLLNQDTKHNFNDFVTNLTMQNGTILYHAVNTGIKSLSSAKIPENLINVSIVTFTDGLDQGSYVLSENNYNSGAEYLAAVNTKINNENNTPKEQTKPTHWWHQHFGLFHRRARLGRKRFRKLQQQPQEAFERPRPQCLRSQQHERSL